ncbi:hypothetical protein D187_005052 [Cystobacter fuscus DSM 2262]|uniref:Uncharacterized protein n=1 Tax=Cystobacter fuscus (strain ATCC 25194 / DSM 2262 / NBRC 100088 / M29) TaxID=1242864 RepID=S9QRJ7_CYSF2|nr:hypothetical protein [Cystobacter fuscus]EPX63919.1 hypothetical protein D187_005052 [Cystobacter fuscus DSM 2262]
MSFIQFTWSMAGNHNFLGKAFGLFMNMDKMLGSDLEKGLAQLKTVAEGKALPPHRVGGVME